MDYKKFGFENEMEYITMFSHIDTTHKKFKWWQKLPEPKTMTKRFMKKILTFDYENPRTVSEYCVVFGKQHTLKIIGAKRTAKQYEVENIILAIDIKNRTKEQKRKLKLAQFFITTHQVLHEFKGYTIEEAQATVNEL